MATTSDTQLTVIRTERGLSIADTRITLYDVMDYLRAGWPPKLIRDRLDLTDQQINDVIGYIKTHHDEVEAEYQTVLETAQQIRQYWEERNRDREARIANLPAPQGQEMIREKLRALKDKVESTG
ncbi:MAG: DUF433 domain-containing protein [Blastocatellia bacterium]|nr:DUF433 domain-containing protein [Blastocatellia bacterium]